MCKRFILYALKPFQGETLTQLLKGGESYLSEKEAVEKVFAIKFSSRCGRYHSNAITDWFRGCYRLWKNNVGTWDYVIYPQHTLAEEVAKTMPISKVTFNFWCFTGIHFVYKWIAGHAISNCSSFMRLIQYCIVKIILYQQNIIHILIKDL